MDTSTKLSYLLPTGTFLTFQVLAPLATNNGHCGLTEHILTAVTLALLVAGCIAASFTDSYRAEDGSVHYGFVTYNGLWLPGFGVPAPPAQGPPAQAPPAQAPPAQAPEASSEDKTQTSTTSKCLCWSRGRQDKDPNSQHERDDDFIEKEMYKPRTADYINAALSATAFLTLTMFTDPVSSCFYPHLSETLLKTLPVLLATALSFCCSFASKVRNGYGNPLSPNANPNGTPKPPAGDAV